tara:strand:- start:69 stop:1979 length:1911 start_codon:yes stop_codon:yes gene_type:complete
MILFTENNQIDDYNIYSNKKLKSLIDEKGFINNDIVIRGNEIKSLKGVKKIYGDLGIDSNSLMSLGDLSYIKGDLWISNGENLKTLNFLERVGGDISLRYSNVNSLGKLWRVGGKLNLRDTKVENLKNLKFVKTLFLPKRLKNLNIENIEVKKVRYWKDIINLESDKKRLKNVGGNNLRYCFILKEDYLSDINYHWEEWDSEKGFKLRFLEYPISSNPLEQYYISQETLESQNENYKNYKSKIFSNPSFLEEYKESVEISNFRERLIFDLIKSLKEGVIQLETFIDNTLYFEKVFSKFSCPKMEFLPIYKILEVDENISNSILEDTKNHLSYSQLHELELKYKKRYFTGQRIVSNTGSLNSYIQKNIDEYYMFIDNKLDELYDNKFSLFHSLFGDLKSVNEINGEFPKIFKCSYKDNFSNKKLIRLRKEGLDYIKNNQSNKLFKKYLLGLKKFENESLIDIKKKLWNGGNLWLSYNENPLSYTIDNPYGNEFCYYINNILYQIFNYITFGFQNEFRVSKGLPKIGEGWISETELYYKLKDNLQGVKVIHHGKPKWLGKQHVDIWLPEYNIGIEYQGIQHDTPIDFFGGEEGFIKGKERDMRKKQLFKKNKSYLIEVREGYNIEDLLKEINQHIKKM